MHQKTSDRWPRCPAKCFVPEFDEALALRIGSPFASSPGRVGREARGEQDSESQGDSAQWSAKAENI